MKIAVLCQKNKKLMKNYNIKTILMYDNSNTVYSTSQTYINE